MEPDSSTIDFFDRDSGRLRLDGPVDLLPVPLLRKYIAYAREYVHPRLGAGAKEAILTFYERLRESRFSQDSTTITHRQLESLVRLTQVPHELLTLKGATIESFGKEVHRCGSLMVGAVIVTGHLFFL